jgi:hypothetical protein
MAPPAEEELTDVARKGRLRPVWRRLKTGAGMLSRVGPELIISRSRRSLLREMLEFTGSLGSRFQMPLHATMAELTVDGAGDRPDAGRERTVRNLADFAVYLRRQPALGLCVQRSLTRYYFLRRAGLPVQVHFGVQPVRGGDAGRIMGHAWLTLEGEAYWEDGGRPHHFTTMLTFPGNVLEAN